MEYDRLPLSDAAGFHKHVWTLTSSQKEFVALLNDWFRDDRAEFQFVLVTGGPGCGKTHAVVETLKFLDLQVLKMSYVARHAFRIGGRTVHSTMNLTKERGLVLKDVWYRLEDCDDIDECMRVSARLVMFYDKPVDIVVVDEMGNLPAWVVLRMGLYFRDKYPVECKRPKPVMVIGMGDPLQLKPVKSKLNVFNVDFGKWIDVKRIEMKESKRFTEDYEKIVNRLRALMALPLMNDDPDNHPLFQYIRVTFPIAECLTQDMMRDAHYVLAFRNDTVDACNDFYLDQIMGREQEFQLPTLDKTGKRVMRDDDGVPRKRLRRNCQVVVTENDCGDDLCNGTVLKFLDYDSKKDEAVCLDETVKQEVRVRRSKFAKQIPLVPGFSVTIHKFQGETIDYDGIVMCFDQSKDLNLIYTALSRVRDMKQIKAVIF